MKREMVYKIMSKDWRSKYRKGWLREMINKKRMQKKTIRPISAWELNAVIEEKMKEIGTCMESEAIEALIEEVRNGKEY
jgi:hypothetical protein